MKKWLLITFMFPFCGVFAQYTEADIYAYIEQYKNIAMRKMHEYQIPASITLAQGVFESACGTSRLAIYGNNHFGIKCHKEWEGDTLLVDDDEKGECFRKYEKTEDSFNDHSLFLTSRPRYADLFNLEILDYKAWAQGLKKAGCATNPQYAERIISLVERFSIARIDTLYITLYKEKWQNGYFEEEQLLENKQDSKEIAEVSPSINTPAKIIPIFFPNLSNYRKVAYPFSNRDVYENNKTIFVVAQKGDTYSKIATATQLNEKTLRSYNEVDKNKTLKEGEIVYLEKKNKMNKDVPVHTVQKGETLHYISQKYSVQLPIILKMNNLNIKSVIKTGDRIQLFYK